MAAGSGIVFDLDGYGFSCTSIFCEDFKYYPCPVLTILPQIALTKWQDDVLNQSYIGSKEANGMLKDALDNWPYARAGLFDVSVPPNLPSHESV